MSAPDSSGFSVHRGQIYAIYGGGLLALVVLLAVLERVGVANAVIGYVVVLVTLASYAAIGIAARTLKVSEFYVAGRRVPPLANGMATAAGWISSLSFLAIVGALYRTGFEALAFVLGGAGGYLLLAVLVAPYLRKSGALTLPDFLAVRFGGNVARLLAVIVLVSSSFPLLVAQIAVVGLIASRFLGIGFDVAIYLGLAILLLSSVLGGMRAVTWTQVAQYIVLTVAYLVPVVIISIERYGLPIPQITYGEALREIEALQQQGQGAAAGAADGFGGSLVPFGTADPFDFFLLVLTLAVGTASMPHILLRSLTTSSVRGARKSMAWALLFAAILLLTAPAYAAFAKVELLEPLVGSSIEALPAWVYKYGRLGLVQVCGADAVSLEAVRAACLLAGNPEGLLGAGQLSIEGDAIALALPEIAGLPYVGAALVAAGGIAAGLAAANALLVAIANALSHDVYFRIVDPKAPTGRRLVLARILLIAVAVVAAYLASTRPSDVLSMLAWAFSLAAAGNFPALVLGIWWKRCTIAGALAGIVAGFGVTLLYLIGTQYGFDFARGTGDEWALWSFFGLSREGVANISAAIFGVPVGFLVTIGVSLVTLAPSPEVQAFVEEIRRPRGETLLQEKAA